MAHVSFNYAFEEYSTDSAKVKNLLRNSNLTEQFEKKVKSFKNEKLEKLMTELYDDIYYDDSVYTGSAGSALLYYTLATKPSKPDRALLLRSMNFLNLDNLKKKRISFLCGDSGPLAIATVISYHLGSGRPDIMLDHKTLSKRIIDLDRLLDNSPDELLYGKSGYLYSLLFVNKQIGNEVIPAAHIKKVIQEIFKSGKMFAAKTKSQSPLLWQWHNKIYLGGAHGVAGILYLLLQARQYICEEDMKGLVEPTLSWLLGLQFPSGNFPSSLESTGGDRLVQWCHGAPGFTPLCLLAHEVFRNDMYLEMALRCGEVVWRRMCTKGFSLCHGVSGNAYTFIQLYQATKDVKHLYRACCFMEWCMLEPSGSELHPPDRPASLFEGLPGRIMLADDILHLQKAAFPAYTL